jgi:3-dehydroquinate synthase
LLVYDQVLCDVPGFEDWAGGFELRYDVTGGEALKDLAAFPVHMEKILALVAGMSSSAVTVVAVGGGSVGDFAGFLASVLKRGVGLVHVPSTWLAALDSAHGGKTALNVGPFKNQIGTFFPADEVWVVRSLLERVPPAETRAAYGELLKTAALEGGDLFRAVEEAGVMDAEVLWRLAPPVVDAKLRVVADDPFERTGRRRVLNLGHTFGHALEGHFGLPHGVAVGLGLRFAVDWSGARGHLSVEDHKTLVGLLDRFEEFSLGALPADPTWTVERLLWLVAQDKKAADDGRLHFVFLEGIGAPAVELVSVGELTDEAQRQGWVQIA